jgi:polyisoprenoid-binding protein YceI
MTRTWPANWQNKERKTMKKLLCIATIAAAASFGCSKDKAEPKQAEVTETKPEPAKAQTPEPAKADPAPREDSGDYVRVLASHSPAKPGDPVTVAFASFKITKSNFDPANLEGGTAELEIDLGSVSSGVDKRDGHLKSPDFLNVAGSPMALIKIADVKKKDGSTYSATAEVTAHGMTKSLPVEFSVIDSSGSTISIKASKEFSRLDFGIGKAEGDPTEATMTMEMALTLTAG